MKKSFLNRLQARKYPGLLLTLVSTLVVQTVGTYVQHPPVLKDVFWGAPASSTAPISPHNVLLPMRASLGYKDFIKTISTKVSFEYLCLVSVLSPRR